MLIMNILHLEIHSHLIYKELSMTLSFFVFLLGMIFYLIILA